MQCKKLLYDYRHLNIICYNWIWIFALFGYNTFFKLVICWFKTINIQIPFETTKYQCNCQFRENKKTYVPILSMVGLRQRCWELKRTICSTIDNLWRVVTIFSTTKFYYINNLAPIFNRQSPCLDSAWKFKFRLVLAAHKYCKYKSHERRVCM